MQIIEIINILLTVMLTVSFYTLMERKVIASVQRRVGPNVVGYAGLLQPFADGLKAAAKGKSKPWVAPRFIFLMAPILSLTISLSLWNILPIYPGYGHIDTTVGILYFIGISSLGSYGVVLAGWASNSRFALLGGLRGSAQVISYEVFLGLCLVPIILLSNSLNLYDIMFAQKNCLYVWLLLPLQVIFFVGCLAETNRTPFDLPEAEAELVAGYNVEYSGFIFAVFFLSEYSSMLFMSCLNSILFWGGFFGPFDLHILFSTLLGTNSLPFLLIIKTVLFAFLFVIVRATFPRYRFDQLMELGWKIYLPLVLSYLVIMIQYQYFVTFI